MTRAELIKANEELHARRVREAIGQPKPIETPTQALAANNGMTLEDYFSALRAGLPVQTEKSQIDTSRAKWESFNPDRHPALIKAVAQLKRWYSDRLDQGGGLILAGNYGCGKTHLAQAIYGLYGYGAVYWTELKLVEKIQAGYGGNGSGRSLESIATEARRAKLLILDDLGAYETDNLKWIQNIYTTLLDARFEEGKATMATTNLKLIEVGEDNEMYSPLEQRLGGRTFSRLMGQLEEVAFYVPLFDVPDYRLRNF